MAFSLRREAGEYPDPILSVTDLPPPPPSPTKDRARLTSHVDGSRRVTLPCVEFGGMSETGSIGSNASFSLVPLKNQDHADDQ